MRQRDRESVTDSDHGLFFDPSDDESFFGGHGDSEERDEQRAYDEPERAAEPAPRVSRSERRAEVGRRARRRRNRRAFWILSGLLVLVVVAATFLVGLPIYHYLVPDDYSGNGTGTVVVEVRPNDDANAIGSTLHDKGVVASVKAFEDAAKGDSRSRNIQPGTYQLHKHMSAKNALRLLLDPAARVKTDVVVTEGATTLDIVKRLSAPPCSGGTKSAALCGPGLPKAGVTAALAHVAALGLPTDYKVGGRTPRSAEGFLYPATYYFPTNTTPAEALGQMISNFTDQVRSTNFTAAARANHLTPYQQLVIASIAQAEAKYPADYAKVARVILNRLAAHRPLQIDATSVYGARLQGLDVTKVIHSQVPGPYNTYTNVGLPPTPISNPGASAMEGAAHPAPGNWMYYVNGDAQGHLFFTNSEAAFAHAAAVCKANHWGCG